MSARNNGGPAFPRAAGDYNGTRNGNGAQDGMSLRDYFAAKAMHAELATAGMHDGAADALVDAAAAAGQTIEQRIAFNAYRLADAMLAERAKGGAA